MKNELSNLLNYKGLNRPKFSKINMLFFVLIFVFIGASLILATRAATITGDINGDNTVNITDLSFLLSSYGQNTTQCTNNINFKCDLSNPSDGVVNVLDLSILLTNYGKSSANAPINTAVPTVTGESTQGKILTASNGTWSGSPTNYSYAWQDCNISGASCTNINGANASTYTLSSTDTVHTIKVVVTASNSGGSASAASAATVVVGHSGGTINPGPAGDFSWKGLNWVKRADPGSPSYNGLWSKSNVTGPDSSGYLTFHITNPNGNNPVSAEIDSTRTGFGYGTYTVVVGTNLSGLNKSLVNGCLFTYDDGNPPTYNEMDICETSAWGATGPVGLDHTYYKLVNGSSNGVVDTVPIPSIPEMTHRLIWTPGQLIFDSFAGTGTTGQLISHTVQTSGVAIPHTEALVYNLWAFNSGAANVAPFDVVVRDLSFAPAQ
jgi:hypothetical protein